MFSLCHKLQLDYFKMQTTPNPPSDFFGYAVFNGHMTELAALPLGTVVSFGALSPYFNDKLDSSGTCGQAFWRAWAVRRHRAGSLP